MNASTVVENQFDVAIERQFNEEEMAAINKDCVEAVRVSDILNSAKDINLYRELPQWVLAALAENITGIGATVIAPTKITIKTEQGNVVLTGDDWLVRGDNDTVIPFHPTNPSIDSSDVIEIISHHFMGGVYLREMRIKDGFKVKQHAHTYDHTSLLSKGCVLVESDGHQETYYAPTVITIKKGVKHEVTPVNGDAHWTCAHRTGEKDIAKLDEVLIEKQKEA